MFKSESIKELAAALVKAQATMSNATVNSENAHFHNEYADLPAVRDAILPHLTREEIAITQIPGIVNGTFGLTTLLIHAPSGEFLGGVYPLQGTTPQQIGSAITYARRQTASAVAFVSADNDDDAEGAEGRQTAIVRVAQAGNQKPPSQRPANDDVPFVKLEPQELPFDQDFLGWGTRLAAQLNAATSAAECAKWINSNASVLNLAKNNASNIFNRLMELSSREFEQKPKAGQPRQKKTDARDGTSGKSAADTLDGFRLELLKAKNDTELNVVLDGHKSVLTQLGSEVMDQAVAMYETRMAAIKKAAANIEHKAA